MNGRADCLMRCSTKSSSRRNRERRMLTVSALRSILTAAIGKEAGAFIDTLQARRMLPGDGTALTPRSVIVALLALISGEEPAAAASAGLRLTEYQLTLGGIARRPRAVPPASMISPRS